MSKASYDRRLSLAFALALLVSRAANACPDGYLIRASDGTDSLTVVNALLAEGTPVYRLDEGISSEGHQFATGDYLVSIRNDVGTILDDVYRDYAERVAHQNGVTLEGWQGAFSFRGHRLHSTRAGVYYGLGTSGGALWHLRPAQTAGFEVDILTEANLANDEFGESNVITFPSGGFYSGYIGELGNAAVQRFVAAGNGFLGTCGGSVYGVDLGLLDVALDMQDGWPAAADLRGPLQMSNERPNHRLLYGIGETWQPNYWSGQNFVTVGPAVTVLSKYLSTTSETESYDPAISRAYGYFPVPGTIDRFWGRPGIVTGNYGAGTVILSGVHPEYAPETQPFHLNALLSLTSEPTLEVDSIDLPSPASIRLLPTTEDPGLGAGAWRIPLELVTLSGLTEVAREGFAGLEVQNEEITDAVGEFLVEFLDDQVIRTRSLAVQAWWALWLHLELGQLHSELARVQGQVPSSIYEAVQSRIQSARVELAQALRMLDALDPLHATCRDVHLRITEHRTALEALLALRDAEGESAGFYAGVIELYGEESETLHQMKLESEYFVLKADFATERAISRARFVESATETILGLTRSTAR